MKTVNLKIWEPVTKKSQLKEGSIIKIIGIAEKNSYKRITIKKVLKMKSANGHKWTEILINKKKNYYFHLDAYLKNEPAMGKWVKELYVRKPKV